MIRSFALFAHLHAAPAATVSYYYVQEAGTS